METKSQLQVPESLTTQIREYRSVVRIRKIAEAIGIAVTAVLVGFAVVTLIAVERRAFNLLLPCIFFCFQVCSKL